MTPLVAEAAEESDEVRVRRVTRMGMWLSIFYGLAVTIPFFWAEDILVAIGQDPEVAALGHLYLQIVIWQMIPALLVWTLKAYLAALEHTAIILWATVGTAVLNALINYLLIFGNWGFPELGIKGAAIASLIVNIATVIWLAIYIMRKLPQYELFKNFWRSDSEIMARVFKLGWPIGLTSLAEGGLFSASAVMMGWIGALELAAHGIAIQLAGTPPAVANAPPAYSAAPPPPSYPESARTVKLMPVPRADQLEPSHFAIRLGLVKAPPAYSAAPPPSSCTVKAKTS